MNELDSTTQALLVFVVLIVIAFILIGFVKFYVEFSRELQYINTEILRNTGRARKYWKRQKRNLLLSLIPFIKF